MHSSNPLLKLDTAQYRQLPFQSGYLTASLSLLPFPPLFPSHPPPSQNLLLILSPSPLCFALPPLFFYTLPPPPSAFDDLSQAHGGEYSKAGYGSTAQSQAKSAGSGPGKGTCTTHGAHSNNTQTHTQLVGVFQGGKTGVLTIADDSTVESVLEKGVYMQACDFTFMCKWLGTC